MMCELQDSWNAYWENRCLVSISDSSFRQFAVCCLHWSVSIPGNALIQGDISNLSYQGHFEIDFTGNSATLHNKYIMEHSLRD